MSIQQNINQLLAMGGIASQLPIGQEIAENSRWKRSWNKLQSSERKMGVDYKNPQVNESNVRNYEQSIIARENLLSKGEGQLANNPSERNMIKQVKARQQLEGMRNAYNAYMNQRPAVDGIPNTGNMHMQANGQQQVMQKRNFSDYLSRMSTSLGGTVGDLSPQLQKAIASQYTKNQRKDLMDKMDKERE